MSLISQIANQYAKAAFSVAKTGGIIEKFLKDLKLFSDNIPSEFAHELSNPAISKKDLTEITNILTKKLSIGTEVTNFLTIVAEAKRIGIIGEIYQNFLKLAKSDKKILEVKLFVINYLQAEQLANITNLLQKKYPDNSLEINQIIKPDILGGMVIQIDSLVIDASLRNQLQQIATEFNSVIA